MTRADRIAPEMEGYAEFRRWTPQDGEMHELVFIYWRGRLIAFSIDGAVQKQPPRLLRWAFNSMRLTAKIIVGRVYGSALIPFPTEVAGDRWGGYA